MRVFHELHVCRVSMRALQLTGVSQTVFGDLSSFVCSISPPELERAPHEALPVQLVKRGAS